MKRKFGIVLNLFAVILFCCAIVYISGWSLSESAAIRRLEKDIHFGPGEIAAYNENLRLVVSGSDVLTAKVTRPLKLFHYAETVDSSAMSGTETIEFSESLSDNRRVIYGIGNNDSVAMVVATIGEKQYSDDVNKGGFLILADSDDHASGIAAYDDSGKLVWSVGAVTYDSLMDTGAEFSGAVIFESTPEPNIYPLEEGGEIKLLLKTISEDFSSQTLDLSESATGLKVLVEPVQTAMYMERFHLATAAGEQFDLMSMPGNIQNQKDGRGEHLFLPLNDLISTFCPNYIDAMKNHISDVLDDDGNIYAFWQLGYNDMYTVYGIGVKTDILSEMNADPPETYDELGQFLEFAQSREGFHPFGIFESGLNHSDWLTSGFDISLAIDNLNKGFYQIDGAVKFGAAEEGYKDYISLMQNWYSRGLIELSLSQPPMGAAAFYNTGTSIEYTPIPDPVREMNGMTHLCAESLNSGVFRPTLGIPAGMDVDAERAVKWMDWWYSEEAFSSQRDEFVYWAEEFEARPPILFAMSKITAEDWDNGLDDIFLSELVVWQKNKDNAYMLPSSLQLRWDNNDIVDGKLSLVLQLTREMTIKLIRGEAPLSEMDRLQKQLWDAGLDECLEVYQSALDRYYERGK